MGLEGWQWFGAFGVDEALCRDALGCALSRGADFAELFFEHSIQNALGLEDGAVNRAASSVSLGVGVRAVFGDQTGYAFTADLSRDAVLGAARSAALIAEGSAKMPPLAFVSRKLQNFYPVDRAWSEVPVSEQMPLLSRLEAVAMGYDPRIVKTRASFSTGEQRVMVVDSEGHVAYDLRPMTRAMVGCTAEQGGRRESYTANIASRQGVAFLSDARLVGLAEKAAKRTLFLFDASPAPAGVMPIVLGAGASGILLHEAIGHGMEADFNRKGVSVYADKMDQRIAPPGVTIVDDGTWISGRGSINCDDEGVESQRTVLVEDGILRSYMHDKISARHYGVKPTGNGRRESFRDPPLPRMRNTLLLNGPCSPEDIIRSVDKGIYAESFLNGQVMIGAGDFTFYIKTGYMIEGGRLTRPIKDTNIIGNGPEVLKQTDMVGNDFQFDEGGWTCGKDGQSVPVSLGMPTVRVAQMTVGGVGGAA